MSRHLGRIVQAANAALIGEGRLDAVAEFFSADYVAHLTDRNVLSGHAGILAYLRRLRRAFPELRVEVEILLEGRERVAWQRRLRGIHRASFKGYPATGRSLLWRDMITSRFRGGRIAEEWVISDMAERLLLARKR
jgi:steroid delta-isomerase-like uncharacterized protein